MADNADDFTEVPNNKATISGPPARPSVIGVLSGRSIGISIMDRRSLAT